LIRIKYNKQILLILIFAGVSIFINPAMFSSEQFQDSTIPNNDDDFSQETLKYSSTGNHPWWNPSFRSRQLINVTNIYSVNFENFGVSFSFNYTELVAEGKLNESLKDIRIIEYIGDEPIVQKYYFERDYPTNDIATIWFDTNVTASTTETDTYLYYGNNDAEILTSHFMNKSSNSAADNFGWVRNGNFELDSKPGTLIDDVFGWYWSDDIPPSDFPGDPDYVPNIPGSNYQHNLSTYTGQHEQVYEGTYSFKWGDTAHRVDTGGTGSDFIGTLFSTPFVVPKVSGGSNKIYVHAWRNIRVYDNSVPKQMEYFVKISKNFNTDVNIGHDAYPGITYSGGYVENWESVGTNKNDKETVVEDQFNIPDESDTALGELTEIIYVDVTDYQGEAIFLEFVMYGEEGAVAAFGQVDDVRFNYTLDITLNPEVEDKRSDITIITRDIDGRIVPNAEVSIVNMTLPSPILDTKNTSLDDASIVFTGLDYGTYNITVNYTIPNAGIETVIYDSSLIGERNFIVDQSRHNFTIILDMWAIDFEIVDSSKEPLNYGYIKIYNNTKGGDLLDTLTLDSEGKTTFRWKNQTSYYYEVYYSNEDYNLNPIALNESYIYRHDYDKAGSKYIEQTLYVNQTNTATGNFFSVSERIYSNGSRTILGNKKISEVNITLTGMDTYLNEVSIYYIDEDNSTEGNLIFYDDSYTISDNSDFIPIDIREPPINPSNLKSDAYEVFGLLIEVNGQNTTQCNGVIKIDLVETTNIYNITELSKVNIRIIDSVGNGVVGCLVKVNGTTSKGYVETVLLTKDLGNGYAFGQINSDLPFWFLKGYTYDFSLVFFGTHKDLIVNNTQPSQWTPGEGVNVYYYNYTVYQASNLTFEIYLGSGVNTSNYETRFESLTFDESVDWGQNITVQANFSLTTDNWNTIDPVTPPAEVICIVKSTGLGSKVFLTLSMESVLMNGVFSTTFNSSLLSAGGNGELYSIIITGSKPGYSDPTDISDAIFVSAVSTNLTLHDYHNSLIQVNGISQIYGELINLTIKYFTNTSIPLEGATLTYTWLNLDPIQFYEDPINDGFYTTAIDTSITQLWGLKSIKIIASLENYTTQTFIASINIQKRPTTLNGKTDLEYVSTNVWVEKPHNFTYEYKDILTGSIIDNLDNAIFAWQELDADANPILGSSGSGVLIEAINKTYTLSFNTERRSIGYYYLYVTLQKNNYEERAALINLEIILREFEAELVVENQVGNQIDVVQGSEVNLEISLIDLTRNNITLENVSVNLSIGGSEYVFNETSPGIYSLVFETKEIEAFFAPNLLAGIIYISKDNFTSQQVRININVQMEEIFPGMSAFYFILIVAAIIGVVGSLSTYRVVQQARIPKFVKKVRKVKGSIKSKKVISESLVTKTKDQMMVKLYGDDWKELELSLGNTLGIVDLKLKPTPLKAKKSKNGGDRD